ncbi:hypothetical protein A2U01_0107705, partial [Trifolium medium]|nr:hypothetical protein [Trifolium medium]
MDIRDLILISKLAGGLWPGGGRHLGLAGGRQPLCCAWLHACGLVLH